MLNGLVAGVDDPATLAQLAKKRLRAEIPVLEQALQGSFAAHLAHLEHLDEMIDLISQEITARFAAEAEILSPNSPAPAAARSSEESIDLPSESAHQPVSGYSETIERLQTIPGVGQRVAEIIVTEIGLDMSRFPTPGT